MISGEPRLFRGWRASPQLPPCCCGSDRQLLVRLFCIGGPTTAVSYRYGDTCGSRSLSADGLRVERAHASACGRQWSRACRTRLCVRHTCLALGRIPVVGSMRPCRRWVRTVHDERACHDRRSQDDGEAAQHNLAAGPVAVLSSTSGSRRLPSSVRPQQPFCRRRGVLDVARWVLDPGREVQIPPPDDQANLISALDRHGLLPAAHLSLCRSCWHHRCDESRNRNGTCLDRAPPFGRLRGSRRDPAVV